MSNLQDMITVAKIVNTQGHLGEVRALPLTDYPERFYKMPHATLELEGVTKVLTIEKVHQHKNFIVFKFKEITSMNDAIALKGSEIKVSRDELVQLPEGSFYIFDLIGLDVLENSGRFLGKVKNILTTGSNDVYVIAREEQKDLLIPALKTIVEDIDLAGGKILVKLPPGLEDI